jgi:D-proline reductase (dithiol) PrdB
VCALGYYLEREGLMTTGISLVRENTQSMRPPRALWVSFPLGRPLGVPGDAPFQHRVIAAALELLERPEGPVLEDFPEDAPNPEGDTVAACPVSFPPVLPDTGGREGALREELATLLPWYDLARRRRRGRTLVGLSSEPPEANAGALGRLLDQGRTPGDPRWLKDAVTDLKMLYLEAMTAQPGRHDAVAIEAQFWRETRLGAAILELYEALQRSDDRRLQVLARILAPRNAVGGATGPVDRAIDDGEGT